MQLPDELPVMVLPQVVFFPGSMLPLFIFEPRYRAMLAESLETHRMFCVAMMDPSKVNESPCKVAGVGLVQQSVENKDGTSNLRLQGLARVRLKKLVRHEPYRLYEVEKIENGGNFTKSETEKLKSALLKQIRALEKNGNKFVGKHELLNLKAKKAGAGRSVGTGAILDQISMHPSSDRVVDSLANLMLDNPLHRQTVLETTDPSLRVELLTRFLERESEQIG